MRRVDLDLLDCLTFQLLSYSVHKLVCAQLSDRILVVRLKVNPLKMPIVVLHALTAQITEEETENDYNTTLKSNANHNCLERLEFQSRERARWKRCGNSN